MTTTRPSFTIRCHAIMTAGCPCKREPAPGQLFCPAHVRYYGLFALAVIRALDAAHLSRPFSLDRKTG